nr:ORF1 [Epsilontorquevirus sp.]
MAFWRRRWRRRRRPVWRRRYRRWRRRGARRRRYRYPKRRRRYGRRRRRYRRRRHKVRIIKPYRRVHRKVLRQWEPNAKTFCSIWGTDLLLQWGKDAQHHIMYDNWPWPIKYNDPEGGAMNLMQHTLKNLYTDNRVGRNRWTRSNQDFDLCKYHGTDFWLPRHPYITYTCIFDRTGHFELDKDTYPNLHPVAMMNSKRKVVVYSKQLKPKGRNWIRVKMPPPQTMQTKWYFMRDFCDVPLFTLISCAWEPINTLIADNLPNSSCTLWGFPYYSRPMPYDCFADFFAKCMGPQDRPWYMRHTTIENAWIKHEKHTEWQKEHKNGENSQEGKRIDNVGNAWEVDCIPLSSIHFGMKTTAKCANYDLVCKALNQTYKKGTLSIGISLGRWYPQWPEKWETKDDCKLQTPFSYRYSWREDEGIGNQICIWTRDCREDLPEADDTLKDKPLYILANGYKDYITKHTMHNPLNWQVIVNCPWTKPPMRFVVPAHKNWFQEVLTEGENKTLSCKNTDDYIKNWCKKNGKPNGQGNCESDSECKKRKYPCTNNTETKVCLGSVIRSPDIFDGEKFFQTLYQNSPFAIKLNATPASIHFKYRSKWSWGGDVPRQKPIEDPCNKPRWGTIPVTGYDEAGVLLQDPEKAKPQDILHTGDLRRGNLTKRALKRLTRVDSTDASSPEKKPRRGKAPKTYAEQVEPEDVYVYLQGTPETPISKGKDGREQFIEKFNGTDQATPLQKYKSFVEEMYNERKKARKHREIIKKLLKRQLDRHLQHRLLLG